MGYVFLSSSICFDCGAVTMTGILALVRRNDLTNSSPWPIWVFHSAKQMSNLPVSRSLTACVAVRRFDDVADADFLERAGDVFPRLAGAVGDQCFDFHARNLATIDPCRLIVRVGGGRRHGGRVA